ncbi:MAG: hypothetical protein NUV86_11905 [Candidatus Scalindua sp.]|nr:hypothetical protein [Candidatus Scalindua sp.]MCR4344110.1 hypothetical protein [Candidatus Scalindua sp.]
MKVIFSVETPSHAPDFKVFKLSDTNELACLCSCGFYRENTFGILFEVEIAVKIDMYRDAKEARRSSVADKEKEANEAIGAKQASSEAADNIATCSNDLLIVAEAIVQSCLMIGTTSDDYREVLSSRAKDFKVLAGTYKTRSGRFEGIVQRLADNIPEDVVLPENALTEKDR